MNNKEIVKIKKVLIRADGLLLGSAVAYVTSINYTHTFYMSGDSAAFIHDSSVKH